MLTGIHLSGLCLLSRGGWGWRWLPQVASAGWLAGHLISVSPALDGPRTRLALQTEPRITEEPRDQTGAAFYYF